MENGEWRMVEPLSRGRCEDQCSQVAVNDCHRVRHAFFDLIEVGTSCQILQHADISVINIDDLR